MFWEVPLMLILLSKYRWRRMPDVIRVSFEEQGFTETDARTSLIWSMIRRARLARRTELNMFQPSPPPSQIGDQSGRGAETCQDPPTKLSVFWTTQVDVYAQLACSFPIRRIKVGSSWWGLQREEWYQMTMLRLDGTEGLLGGWKPSPQIQVST